MHPSQYKAVPMHSVFGPCTVSCRALETLFRLRLSTSATLDQLKIDCLKRAYCTCCNVSELKFHIPFYNHFLRPPIEITFLFKFSSSCLLLTLFSICIHTRFLYSSSARFHIDLLHILQIITHFNLLFHNIMRSTLLSVAAVALAAAQLGVAQTFTSCDPTKKSKSDNMGSVS